MNIFSFYFLGLLCVLVLGFYGTESAKRRRMILSAANALFLASYLTQWWDAVGMLVFLVAGYIALVIMRTRPRAGWGTACILLSVVFLLLVKRYQFLELVLPESIFQHPIELIGISYMTFKFIHMAVDQYEGQLDRFDFVTYANYQAGLFSLVAGPIQRYNDFAAFWRDIGSGADNPVQVLRGWRRTLIGMLKMGVLGTLAWHLQDVGRAGLAADGDRWTTLGYFLLVFYAYPAYVYFNFAGYCDVVIGAAAMLGMKQQENFNRPYLARNLQDFWNRWHVSLSLWIRDYIFTPSYKWVATRWSGHAKRAGYGLLFLALLIAGVWHGASWNFVAFGLIHGIGVAAVQLYGDLLKARLGRAGVRRYLAMRSVHGLAIVATIHYVCVAFLFFPPGLMDTLKMLHSTAERVF